MKYLVNIWLMLPFLVMSQTKSLYEIAVEYKPDSVAVNIDDFGVVDLNKASDKNDLASFIILLKQYDYHLKCCNQSYDLISNMQNEQMIILDLALSRMGLSKSEYREGLGSWIPYEYLEKQVKDFERDKVLSDLMISISKERKRINRGDPFKN